MWKMEGEGLDLGVCSKRRMLRVHQAEASLPDAIKVTKSEAAAARAGSGAW